MMELREHAGDGGLGQIRALAYAMEPPAPGERSSILRSEAALLLVGLLTRCARGIGAIDVAIGEGLASLSVGDRLAQLGYAKHGDYSRERLDMAPGSAQKKVQLAKGLRDRPKLRDAVWLGVLRRTPLEYDVGAVGPSALGREHGCGRGAGRTGN